MNKTELLTQAASWMEDYSNTGEDKSLAEWCLEWGFDYFYEEAHEGDLLFEALMMVNYLNNTTTNKSLIPMYRDWLADYEEIK